MTDYNDGKWHGWNGGECPVHPDSRCDLVLANGNMFRAISTNGWSWSADEANPIIAFRVVTPYAEPETYEGECWAYHYVGSCPTTANSNPGANSIPGKWTAEHVNGKLRRFSWEAAQ
jgi:hypothetical protein